MRSTLDPLLPTAAREAIQVIDADPQASGTLKKSVRRLLVDQREFSSTFFSAVEREIDAAVDDLFRADRDDRKAKEKEEGAPAAALSLVDYDQMEENMLLDRFAARIRNAADEHFGPLTQRLASVLKVQGLSDRENPFHPVRFCRALGEAVEKLDFKGDQRLVPRALRVLRAAVVRDALNDGDGDVSPADVAFGRLLPVEWAVHTFLHDPVEQLGLCHFCTSGNTFLSVAVCSGPVPGHWSEH